MGNQLLSCVNGSILVGSLMAEEAASSDVQIIAGNQVVALSAYPKCWCGFSFPMIHSDNKYDHQVNVLANGLSDLLWVLPEADLQTGI